MELEATDTGSLKKQSKGGNVGVFFSPYLTPFINSKAGTYRRREL